MNTFPTVVLLPDGSGVRNFLLGGFMTALAEENPSLILHQMADEAVAGFRRSLGPRTHWARLQYREPIPSFLLRNALTYAQLYWARTRSMRFNLRQPSNQSWRYRTALKTAKALGKLNGSAAGIQRLNRLYRALVKRSPEVGRYRRLFQETGTEILFCSHQRTQLAVPAVVAAQSLGIPCVTFIFSWDNLSSKGRIPAPFDHYLVWSPLMKEELQRYYPDVAPDRIHVVGTPQFDPYGDASVDWGREAFFQKIGADSTQPLICFSGGDSKTCPEDPGHLNILMELIREGRIKGRPRVILRPAPVDDGRRYQAVLKRFPEVIHAQPDWYTPRGGDWQQILPTKEDILFLANLARHVDLNLNMASTMTLDFAIHDKPVVNLAFDVADPPLFGAPIWEVYYRFEHYRPVVELGAARFARSREELAQHINDYLADPGLDRENRRNLVDLQVQGPIGQAYRRVVDHLTLIRRREQVSP